MLLALREDAYNLTAKLLKRTWKILGRYFGKLKLSILDQIKNYSNHSVHNRDTSTPPPISFDVLAGSYSSSKEPSIFEEVPRIDIYQETILDISYNMFSAEEFRIFCNEILRALRYDCPFNGDVVDCGIDFIIHLRGKKIAVLCKRLDSKVGSNYIRNVFSSGIYHRCDSFWVISASGFSDRAKVLAKSTGVELYSVKYFLDRVRREVVTRPDFNPRMISTSLWPMNGNDLAAIKWLLYKHRRIPSNFSHF